MSSGFVARHNFVHTYEAFPGRVASVGGGGGNGDTSKRDQSNIYRHNRRPSPSHASVTCFGSGTNTINHRPYNWKRQSTSPDLVTASQQAVAREGKQKLLLCARSSSSIRSTISRHCMRVSVRHSTYYPHGELNCLLAGDILCYA